MSNIAAIAIGFTMFVSVVISYFTAIITVVIWKSTHRVIVLEGSFYPENGWVVLYVMDDSLYPILMYAQTYQLLNSLLHICAQAAVYIGDTLHT